jgi:hypothetical protein
MQKILLSLGHKLPYPIVHFSFYIWGERIKKRKIFFSFCLLLQLKIDAILGSALRIVCSILGLKDSQKETTTLMEIAK